MTAETTTKDTTTKTRASASDSDVVRNAQETVADAAASIRSMATAAADRAPEAVSTTREAIAKVDRQVRSQSDEMVTVGAALAFGTAVGLLIGGSNRLLVAVALVPAGFLAADLLGRGWRRPAR